MGVTRDVGGVTAKYVQCGTAVVFYIISDILPDDNTFRVETCRSNLRRSSVLVVYLSHLLMHVLVFILVF